MTKIALLQLNSSDDPAANIIATCKAIAGAVTEGAEFVLTPEVTNCVSTSRKHQQAVLQHQDEDQTLKALRAQAAELGIWLLIGSLALKTGDADGRFANRSFLISPKGEIADWYDKIHMFDVEVSEAETYRESAGYRPGRRAVLAEAPLGRIGMTICYDIRFPCLYRDLAQAGADILTIPSAFSPVTGAAHWAPLLRARAIETGAYILAPAQVGTHQANAGKPRKTYGHSMVISPWGEVLASGGAQTGIIYAEIDLMEVVKARQRVPSSRTNADYEAP